MYIFEYLLILSLISAVVCLTTYWPVASCLWLVTTALVALPYVSFSHSTIFAYLIAMISLSGVFVLLLYMCLLSEVLFIESNTSFWILFLLGVFSYFYVFKDSLYYSWEHCTGLYHSSYLMLLKLELIFLVVLLFCSAIMLSIHGPSRES